MSTGVKIDIDLRDHVGVCMKAGVQVRVTYDQYLVVVSLDGISTRQRGIIAKRPGAPFLPLSLIEHELGSALLAEVAAAAEAARDAKLAEVPSVE